MHPLSRSKFVDLWNIGMTAISISNYGKAVGLLRKPQAANLMEVKLLKALLRKGNMNLLEFDLLG